MIAQIRLSCHAVLTFFDRSFSVEECDGISRLKALYHAAAATDLVGIFFMITSYIPYFCTASANVL